MQAYKNLSATIEHSGIVYVVENIEFYTGSNFSIDSSSIEPNDEAFINDYRIVEMRPALDRKESGLMIDDIFQNENDFLGVLIAHLEQEL